jgi:hypothetical protein
MSKLCRFTINRRRILVVLAALSGATLKGVFAKVTNSFMPPLAPKKSDDRWIAQMIGANGWPGTTSDVLMWKNMGIDWGRDGVGPGQRYSADSQMPIDKTGPAFDVDLAATILRNNQSGIKSLLLLGYTPKWNASVDGDTKSAPRDELPWEHYVEAAVRTYSAPPYNVKHFQIWNEAAGRLSGGSPQATFWHDRYYSSDRTHPRPYGDAMKDYVERIHIPVARIVRKYGAYVVYGGWPDQGGIDNFIRWLEYRSPKLNSQMLDWVDYLDTHYLGVDDLDTLYHRYVENGLVRGMWQTEIGDRYMTNPHYLPRYFFTYAVWALDRNWDNPDKYVSMIYHWEGVEPFRLTHRGHPRTYNISGLSLVVLRKTLCGPLSPFRKPIVFGPQISGQALYSGTRIVLQVWATPGWRAIDITKFQDTSSGSISVAAVDAITGTEAPDDCLKITWDASALSIRFKVPDTLNGATETPPSHLAYIVVAPLGSRLAH